MKQNILKIICVNILWNHMLYFYSNYDGLSYSMVYSRIRNITCSWLRTISFSFLVCICFICLWCFSGAFIERCILTGCLHSTYRLLKNWEYNLIISRVWGPTKGLRTPPGTPRNIFLAFSLSLSLHIYIYIQRERVTTLYNSVLFHVQ